MRTGSEPTQLVIYAASRLRREVWRSLLSGQPGIAVAGETGDGAGVAALLPSGSPATVFIDDAAPPPEVTRQLKAAAPEAGLLFLVPSYDLGEIIPLLQAGASGCVSQEDSVGDLARAIIAVGRGEIVLPPAIASRALAALARRGLPAPAPGAGIDQPIETLSQREGEVLSMLARGLTNKDIAQTLVLSVRTVESHLRSIYGKLDVRSRTEAALWAVRHGFGERTD